jgi:twitching motility two-component system response regulator PilH
MLKKILLVEDVPEMQKMVAARLKSLHYHVLTVRDGQEALTKIETDRPDLLITDLALPGAVSGSMIIRRLRENEATKDIPIIVLSAYVHRDMGKGVEFPADVYIPKPFKAQDLIDAIVRLIGTVA